MVQMSPSPKPSRPAPVRTRTALQPPAPDGAPADPGRPPTASRLKKEQAILTEAETQFAQFGFEGASLESIAAAIGLSRHNLLYYFPNKEALYLRVLDDVLNQWLAGMEEMSHGDDPHEALRRYIRAKLRSSLERPNAAKVFAKEVIAGAPRYAGVIAERVGPVLKNDVRTFERWAREGRIAKVNFTHLMFIIWSVTQAYADQQAQFALLLGKPALTERDYDKAEELLCHLVLRGLEPGPAAPAQD
ncbi:MULTISPECIES: TetR/AcrR family transcriptional regulator [unclassified Acidovorax]|uniref:TetR/AcrR family transcriptional regulator n=1 Tax=unclassified Acidovorax TaxID=2684926 RepID=UPI0024E13465|nr:MULTISPECIES: TetR/AcrR family transcriptional regulator [unclassified Acidovorax]